MPLFLSANSTAQTPDQGVKFVENGLKFEIGSLTAELTQAFFIGRGFSSKDAAYIAETGCVFRSAIGNAGSKSSAPPVTIELGNWRLHQGGQTTPPRTREDWPDIWNSRGVDETSKIAFHWALFPTVQDYLASDYNWGLLTFALPPGSRFDLEVVWKTGDVRHEKRLNGLECAK